MQRRRTKAGQKNVSVYLGRRNEWQHQMLTAVCRYLNCTESDFFRQLFFDRMDRWGLYDAQQNTPILENVQRIIAAAPPRLPSQLGALDERQVEKIGGRNPPSTDPRQHDRDGGAWRPHDDRRNGKARG